MFIVFKSATPFLDVYTKEILTYVNKEMCARVFMSV